MVGIAITATVTETEATINASETHDPKSNRRNTT